MATRGVLGREYARDRRYGEVLSISRAPSCKELLLDVLTDRPLPDTRTPHQSAGPEAFVKLGPSPEGVDPFSQDLSARSSTEQGDEPVDTRASGDVASPEEKGEGSGPSGSPSREEQSQGVVSEGQVDGNDNDEFAMVIPADEWYYRDDDGKEQGPFDEEKMRSWFEAGFFSAETRVRRACGSPEFKSISESVPAFLPDEARAKLVPPEAKRDTGPQWYYIGDTGEERGPYSERQMRYWYKQGWFDDTTRVRLSTRKVPYPLSSEQCAFRYHPLPPGAASRLRELQAAAKRTPPQPTPSAPWLQHLGAPAVAAPPVDPGNELSRWLYLDDKGREQGPWTTAQMRDWFLRGMLGATVRVRIESEPSTAFVPISTRPAAFKFPQPGAPPVPGAFAGTRKRRAPGAYDPTAAALSRTLDRIDGAPSQPPTYQGPAHQRAFAMASFNARTGRFQNADGKSYWERKGLAPDSAGRQMQHYFDHDAWQAQRNAELARARKRQRR